MWPSSGGLFLELWMGVEMLRRDFQLEPHVVATVVTRRKRLTVYARHLVHFMVVGIMDHGVNSRLLTLLTGLEDLSCDC